MIRRLVASAQSAGSGMQRKHEWREFGLRAVREPDPVKRAALVSELNGVLQNPVREFGSIRVDLQRTKVTRDGKPVHLSPEEFQLLRQLVESTGTPVPRRDLLRAVCGYNTDAHRRTVDVHVANLRRKLERNSMRPQVIVTVPRVGYKFVGSTEK